MSPSLTRRLMGMLFAVILTAWVATAFFSYLDARQKIDEVLDANLAQSALMLQRMLQLSITDKEGSASALSTKSGGVVFRALDRAGETVLRSPHFPDLPPTASPEGFDDVTHNGTLWRIHGLRDPATGSVVQVAEQYAPRKELAGSVVSHLLHPVWIALPVLAGLIWMSVRWGLAPLRSLAGEIQVRSPGKLESIDQGEAPQEIEPLILALNALLARMAEMQDRERRFAADAAHEMRTPLAAIRTHAELARAALSEGERQRALDNVLRGADRAAHLVDQLLVLARLEPRVEVPAATGVSLVEVAMRAVADCAAMAARRNVDLGLIEPEGTDAAVSGNPDLLAMMARNLLDNAVRYVDEGGKVTVSVVPTRAGISLVVADNGPGVPSGEHGRIFDRFYRRLGTVQDGSGLGLSIVARIAELHGAAIAVSTGLEGRGLAITVTFPTPTSHI